jgi:hypothetical protein
LSLVEELFLRFFLHILSFFLLNSYPSGLANGRMWNLKSLTSWKWLI